jgi:superfamily I DNA/RNA helicase
MARVKFFGPPGTGKTRVLISLVEQELAAGITPAEIIFTSFTRAAAGEARERAQTKFSHYDQRDFHWFSTIHSICFRELGIPRDHVFNDARLEEFAKIYKYELSGLNANNYDDQDAPYKESVLQTECDYCEFFWHWMRHRMLQFEVAFKFFMQEHPEVPPAFNRRYLVNYLERRANFKESRGGLWDYTDILEEAIRLDLCPQGIRVVVRDEEQDSSPLLSKVADIWARKAERTYLAGDPEQAIYNWSGADPELFMNWDADETVVLSEGHRCAAAVTQLARVVQSKMKLRYPSDQFSPTTARGEYRHVGYVNWRELLSENKSVFFLHRTRWLVSKSYAELMSIGIPFYTLRGHQSPLQSKVHRPFKACYRLLDGLPITVSLLSDLCDRVSARQWMKRGAKARIKEQKAERPAQEVSLSQLPGLGFNEDFLFHLRRGDMRAIIKGEPDEVTYCERLYRHYGLEVFSTRPHLQVGTYHSVKGMEADIVVLNPEFTSMVRRGYMLNPEPEHRLMYVGVTRAREKVIQLMGDGYVL